MKKIKFLALIIACAMIFAACGSSETETDDATIIEEEFDNVSESEPESPAIEDVDGINESSTSSNDYDAMLNEYEQCVDKYAQLAKKANSGDVNAATEFANQAQKLADIAEKLSAVVTELNQEQLTRYQNISMKLSKVSM